MQILIKIMLAIILSASTIAHAEEAKDAKKENSMVLNTNAFLDKGMLPTLYTCDGKDISPQLDWTGIPATAKSLAIIMTDPNAPKGTFYHWVLYNIPTNTKTIAEGGKAPGGATLGTNSFEKKQYSGPCPPKGTSHNYTIALYALDNKLTLPAGTDGQKVMAAIQKHTVGKVELTTTYSRWIQ